MQEYRDIFRQGIAETYSEFSQTSKIKLFAKIVNNIQLLIVHKTV